MKKLTYILITIFALGVIMSCEEKLAEPVLDINLSTAPGIGEPASGTAFVLTQETADQNMTTFKWSAAQYNGPALESTKYSLQMDVAGNNFAGYVELVNTTETEYSISVGSMNQKLIALELPTGEPSELEFRVQSYVNTDTDYSELFSSNLMLNITPYEDLVFVKPIYILGSGTTVGWSNTDALEMTHLGEGKFAIVEYLTPGADQFVKFISQLGLWAPQWGTDDAGEPGAGNLVYRPDEETPDPAAIPVGEEEGNYYIVADTVNLTYETYKTGDALYLVGDATLAGWDNANGIQFEQDADNKALFTLTTQLTAGDGLGMKLLEVPGAWAPQWGTNDAGTWDTGMLVYRPTEDVDDPPVIPAPSASGTYLIEVNQRTLTYTITPQ
jgi:hypothetical protein